MERRRPHTSTSDLLTWSDTTAADTEYSASRSTPRPNQPSDGITKVLFGGQITQEEAEILNRRKSCSGYKMKEMTGSKIFATDGENGNSERGKFDANFHGRTSVRIVQQAANGISQISFGNEERISPKKPITVPEVAKQRELSGTLENESESKIKKLLSDAKCKELSGNDIFGPPSETPPRSLVSARNMEPKDSKDMGEPAPRSLRTSVKVSNPAGGQSNILFGDEAEMKVPKKLHDQKFAELTGTDIFKGDVPRGSAEKPLSEAKLKEMSGSNIFEDGKVESRDYFGGVRKPPGMGRQQEQEDSMKKQSKSLKTKAAHFVSDLLNPISDKPSNPRPPPYDDADHSEHSQSELEGSVESADAPDTSSFTAFLYSLLASSQSQDAPTLGGKNASHDDELKTPTEPIMRENVKKRSIFSRGKQSLGRAFNQAAKFGGFQNQSPKYSSVMAVGNGSSSKASLGEGIAMQTLKGSLRLENLPETSEPSILLSEKKRSILHASLPVTVQGRKWMLLYSTWRHGISLSTLYRRSMLWPGLSLLVVGDRKGAVFGGLVEVPLRPLNKRKYQGTNDSFVFTDTSGQPLIYRPTGINRYFTLCNTEYLALGGGSHFALYLDGDLLSGSSSSSETYGNPCLSHSQDFDVKEVEVICALILLAKDGTLRKLSKEWTLLGSLTASGLPAAIYALQNSLLQISYRNLDSLTFSMLNQTKLFFTAFFTYIILRQKQSIQQIGALLLLIIAAVLLSIGEGSSKAASSSNTDEILFYGIVPVLVASVLSGLASALCQWASQVKKHTSYLMTVEMSIIGSLCLLASAYKSPDGLAIRQHGFFYGWTPLTMVNNFDDHKQIPVVLNAVGGILVGLVTTYAGGVRKGFVIVSAILVTALLQFIFDGKPPSPYCLVALPLVVTSISVYQKYPYRVKKKAS
ncbi:hypothetical protein F511_00018 [Dorcoceras hygrometricum]|nr:hypothetical protein F511_00018 [Dorcoceras hygrometricum]